MDKLRFDFKMRGASDGKTTILCLTSIGTLDGRSFAIPDEYQPTTFQKELITSQVYIRIKNTLVKRNQFRKVWITLTENLKKVYFDEDNNLLFENFYLEEISEKITETPTTSTSEDTIKKLLEKVLESKEQISEVKNLNKIATDFMIDKFDEKTSNANQWINLFEKECVRCTVIEDRRKIEILKFFLEKCSADWYTSMILKYSIESEWNNWKKIFIETFGNKGWSPIRYAFNFKYQSGSLLEYALKKEKLLLQIRKSMDTATLIDLITIGLPNFVSDNIDRETLQETQDLFNEISKLEHLVKKYSYEKKGKTFSDSKLKKGEEKEPCQICVKANKGKRFHSETNCWFREKEDKNNKMGPLKSVNNSELEVELNTEDPKNLKYHH
ncbi:uncharacterized protein LOC124309826 [Neodiprion virginianus]|uniref:uncharacterized protein LOC124302492 n=1 Tax=Neodiprion virginianus TaxID=2961670 RepID=UPI001EE6F733|nr:uncharacterized protein LOC124302492 [Neodiprion virginianus]XP_046629514.1 uncharacterized protein LOC124309826 [Neodiprion virginianus]